MGWAKLCKFKSSFEKTLTFPAAIETIFFKCIVNKNRALWLPIYSICIFSFKYRTVCLFLSEVSGLLVSFSLYLTTVIRKAQVSLSGLRDKKLMQLKDANIHFKAVRGFGFLRADESWKIIKKNLSLSMAKIMSYMCVELLTELLWHEGCGCFQTFHLFFTIHFGRRF